MAADHEVSGVHLHSDNGNAMKGVTVLVLFFALGIIPSYSRPRVSNDNAYSEALFKTLKYTPGYPKRFTDIAHARIWFADFAHWYNTEHRHSGIGYVTPQARHGGRVPAIMRQRNEVLTEARNAHPERWPNGQSQWKEDPVVYLNPHPETRQSLMKKTARDISKIMRHLCWHILPPCLLSRLETVGSVNLRRQGFSRHHNR